MKDEYIVDATGLTCPQPVLETKRVLDEGLASDFIVQVDNTAAKENVSRFARNQGCEVAVEDKGSDRFDIRVRIDKDSVYPQIQEKLLACPAEEPFMQNGTVVYVATSTMGTGDDELGIKLMRAFLRTWIDTSPSPWRVIFINSGVKLTTTDDEAVDAVSMLEERGVEILSCGTCLQHFGLEDKLRVGKSTNMYEVIESLNQASKVISPD
jgi:selenium metabolism protein YedF